MNGEVERVIYLCRGLRKNGTVIDVETHASAVELGGKLALIGLFLDVTERLRVEREVHALQVKVHEQSIRDALTGLYNRRYLEEALSQELISAERHGHPVSVIMGDLDYFKEINDGYGHLAGDQVLRIFSRLIEQHARGSDICCRFGGEEFLLILPQMEEKIAAERAEQLRCALAATRVEYGPSRIAVTASFGVAAFPHDGRSGEALIAAADSALYAAKAAGRNRVTAKCSLQRHEHTPGARSVLDAAFGDAGLRL
jgi:diguanylate cyclase (GGDEF)-like protein